MRDATALEAAATDFIAKFGAPNIVIANAGVSRGTLTERKEDIKAFQAIFDINVMGMMHTFQPFIAAMKQAATKGEAAQLVGVAETREEALELYAEPALYFYERSLHVDSRFASPPGYASEATLRGRVKSQVAQAAAKATEERASGQRTAFEDIVTKGYVIIGSADEVAERLREVAVNLNIGQMMLLLQFGNMSKDLAFFNTELFAKKVAPQLKGLFESEWENRWWPKPLPAASRASARELRR